MLFSKSIVIASLAAMAKAVTVSYDRGYDLDTRSLDLVACSDGANGLETNHPWKTQGDIPRFPYIGGVEAVAGWNSASCGTCWKLEYEGTSVTILAVDHAAAGYNLAFEAFDVLTKGRGEEVGRIEAVATSVDVSECGI